MEEQYMIKEFMKEVERMLMIIIKETKKNEKKQNSSLHNGSKL